MTIDILCLQQLSDEALLAATRRVVGDDRAVTADLLVHLGEIDARRLYLGRAYPSLFAFCVGELGFSEDVAFNRIQVARLARRFPGVLEALRSGRVHLAGLRLLAHGAGLEPRGVPVCLAHASRQRRSSARSARSTAGRADR